MTQHDEVRAGVLYEAADLICGDRNITYGTPTQNFTNIAALWNTLFAPLLGEGKAFEARHVADAMIAVKLARAMTDVKRDTYVDIAGYAACGYEAYESSIEPVLGVVQPPARAFGPREDNV